MLNFLSDKSQFRTAENTFCKTLSMEQFEGVLKVVNIKNIDSINFILTSLINTAASSTFFLFCFPLIFCIFFYDFKVKQKKIL